MCPVCGYAMQDPPRDYNICPSCGTEFGVSDANSSIEALRLAWIATGAHWWSTTEPKPENWNAAIQLAGLLTTSGFDVFYDEPEVKMTMTACAASSFTAARESAGRAA
jgi:hypothetical protein